MKLLITALLLILSTVTYAVEGKVYFGKYVGTVTIPRAPNDYSSSPKYIGGIEVKDTFFNRVTPYTRFESIMDDYSSEYGSFHPSQISYDLGVDAVLWNIDDTRSITLKLEHNCTHGIDKWTGTVDQYNLIQIEYNFK